MIGPSSLARLRPGRLRALARNRSRASILVVPVPAAEATVAHWRGGLPPVILNGMSLHVTLLYPFVPVDRLSASVEDSLAELFGGVARFNFSLAHVGSFADATYLAPEPPEPFVRLTESVHSRWPEHPPYGGAFSSIIPHMTVATPNDPPQRLEALQARLPIEAEADEIQLMVERRGGGWSLLRSFPLAATTD